MVKSRKIILEFSVRGDSSRPICSSLLEIRTDGFEWVGTACDAIKTARMGPKAIPFLKDREQACRALLERIEELDGIPPDDINRLIGVSFKGDSCQAGKTWLLVIKQVRIVVPGRLDSTINRERETATVKTVKVSEWRGYCETVAKYVTERLALFDASKISTYHLRAVIDPKSNARELVVAITKYPTQAHYVDVTRVGEIDTPNDDGSVLLQLAPAAGMVWMPLYRPIDEVFTDPDNGAWSTIATVRIPRTEIGDLPWVTWEH